MKIFGDVEKQSLKTPSNADGGFVLVLALVVLAVFASLVTLIISGSSSTARLARLAEDEAHERALLQAAAVRSFYGLMAEDTFEPLTFDPETMDDQWSFDSRTVRIIFEPEAGKADLNAADSRIIDTFLSDTALPAEIVSIVGRRIAEARADRASERPSISSVMAMLPFCARLGVVATVMEQRFTVFTRSRGIDPQAMPVDRLRRLPFIGDAEYRILTTPGPAHRLPLDDRRLRHLREVLSDPQPIYTLRLTPEAGGIERVISVQLTVDRPHVRVISDRQVVRAGGDLCED
ncbi:hypothetical protein P7L66_05890 (plasmid) [Tistrella mobilis]|uniref:hypothetical protein n=1 Tax=Tistrella mobilis TaxID=171437 RepID=UPI0035568D7A